MLNNLKTKILERSQTKKILFFLLGDILIISFSSYLAFLLRFDGVIEAQYFPTLKWFIFLTVPIIVYLFWFYSLYSLTWAFVSIKEILRLARAIAIGFLVIAALLFILRDYSFFSGFPRSIIFITAVLVFFTTGFFRFAKRLYLHIFQKKFYSQAKRIIIFGAGETGEQLVRFLTNSRQSLYLPIGFIDDDPLKQEVVIHNVKVLGPKENIPQLIREYDIEELIIAAPSASRGEVREVVNLARSVGIKSIKNIPGTRDILEEKIALSHIRDISLEDLLGRDTFSLETEAIQELISDKKVLVTGASGSIGSYLCGEILKFSPRKLIALDQDETGIFNLEIKLKSQNIDIERFFVVGDIKDKNKIRYLFEMFRPNIIFHAAAYKHVPLMEDHPEEAVKNNVFGLRVVTEAALKYGAEKFIFISTDKAVNPSSVMGMTKRVGEMICELTNQRNHTKFISVRFGNVLDSRGNVISIFREQIKKGGPLEITDPQMKRYFMVTQEAVLLVMQAGAMGKGGEVFVLDMGEPIKILDLAQEMIRLSGFEPDKDIPIIFTHRRPGEKFFEDILTSEEGTVATRHQKIYIAKLNTVSQEKLDKDLEQLEHTIGSFNKELIVDILKSIISVHK